LNIRELLLVALQFMNRSDRITKQIIEDLISKTKLIGCLQDIFRSLINFI